MVSRPNSLPLPFRTPATQAICAAYPIMAIESYFSVSNVLPLEKRYWMAFLQLALISDSFLCQLLLLRYEKNLDEK